MDYARKKNRKAVIAVIDEWQVIIRATTSEQPHSPLPNPQSPIPTPSPLAPRPSPRPTPLALAEAATHLPAAPSATLNLRSTTLRPQTPPASLSCRIASRPPSKPRRPPSGTRRRAVRAPSRRGRRCHLATCRCSPRRTRRNQRRPTRTRCPIPSRRRDARLRVGAAGTLTLCRQLQDPDANLRRRLLVSS